MQHEPSRAALLITDVRCNLAATLTRAYQHCLPDATYINFDAVSPDKIFTALSQLSAGDLVVLVQSTNFRLEAFRFRIELFKRGLKVIEHLHLQRIQANQIDYYIDSLAYDPRYFRHVGNALKQRIDAAHTGVLDSGGEQLIFNSPFEPAKLNVGDYTGMKNIGGQFPIGEVFTEAQRLEAVHGRVRIFAFGDTSFLVNVPAQPLTLVVRDGKVAEVLNSTPAFDEVLAKIRADEGDIWLRELGLGMNRALTRDRIVSDVGTYERMCGVHLSLGAKHSVYNKASIRRATARYHVDVFAITEFLLLDGQAIYQDGAWKV